MAKDRLTLGMIGFAMESALIGKKFPAGALLVLIQVLVWNIFGNLVRANLALIGVGRVFDSVNDFGLESVSFLEQFVHALGICAGAVGQTL